MFSDDVPFIGIVVFCVNDQMDYFEKAYESGIDFESVFARHYNWVRIGELNCIGVSDEDEPIDDEGKPMFPVAGLPCTAITIMENKIMRMGGDGVAVARFFNLQKYDQIISITDLSIEGNDIQNCMRIPHANKTLSETYAVGHGGISLSDCEMLLIRNNRIIDNGKTIDTNVCGIFVQNGEGVVIEGNHILANGNQTQARSLFGNKGGIVLPHIRPTAPVAAEWAKRTSQAVLTLLNGSSPDMASTEAISLKSTTEALLTESKNLKENNRLSFHRAAVDSGIFPALHIHDNIVVAPTGCALKIFGAGKFIIEGNQLKALSPNLASEILKKNMGQLIATIQKSGSLNSIDILSHTVCIINWETFSMESLKAQVEAQAAKAALATAEEVSDGPG